jgi:hypothetical protein
MITINQILEDFGIPFSSTVRFVQTTSEMHANGQLDLQSLAAVLNVNLLGDDERVNLAFIQYVVNALIAGYTREQAIADALDRTAKLFIKHPYLLKRDSQPEVDTNKRSLDREARLIYDQNHDKVANKRLVELIKTELQITAGSARYYIDKFKKIDRQC